MVTTARSHGRPTSRPGAHWRGEPRHARTARRRIDPATFELDESIEREERTRNTAEWVIMICAAILAAFFVKAFMFQAFWIPSGSMEPTLMVGDRILVDKITYHATSVQRGDIVVFKRPPNSDAEESVKELVKRVIGLPGDTVEARGGLLYRNGQLVSEPYLPPGTRTMELPPTVVPEGQLWVMGDNRGGSSDSRIFGPIDSGLVEGKAFFKFWPLSDVGRL